MMKIKFLFIVGFSFLISYNLLAQPGRKKMILGKWQIEKIVAAQNPNQLINTDAEMKNGVVEFLENGTFETYTAADTTRKDTGTYTVSEDGKFLEQDGAKAMITELTDEKLVMSIEGVEIHLKRYSTVKN